MYGVLPPAPLWKQQRMHPAQRDALAFANAKLNYVSDAGAAEAQRTQTEEPKCLTQLY